MTNRLLLVALVTLSLLASGARPVESTYLPRSVKSVQRGTITIAAASLSNTATITAVVTANTRLVWLGNSSSDSGGGGSGAGPVQGRVALTNSTTVTASRTASDGEVVVSFEVIEYHSGILRSVQRGTVNAVTAASGTATLGSAVTSLSKSTLDVLGWEGNTAHAADNYKARVVLTNTTTVTMTRIGTSFTLTAGYQVTEFR